MLGLRRFCTEATAVLPAGKHQVDMEFNYAGGGLGKGGAAGLYLGGNLIGEGVVEATSDGPSLLLSLPSLCFDSFRSPVWR